MSNDVIKDLSAHELSIDCHRLTVRQRGDNGNPVYDGCGTLSQSSDGTLTVKAFVSAPSGNTIKNRFNAVFSQLRGSKAGEIIPDEEYFELTAHSINGPVWTCDRFLPHFKANFVSDGMMCFGELWQLRTEEGAPGVTKGDELTLYYRNRPEFPCNVSTKTETSAGERKSQLLSWNVARFEAAGYEFMAETNEHGMVVCAWTNSGKLQEHFETRISEALSFAFGAEFTPFAMSKSSTEGKALRLFSEAQRARESSYPPLQCGKNDPNGHFWHLFDRYLTHICSHQSDHWHPLSSHVIAVIRAAEGSVDAQALTLAIAVEGVLKCAFPNAGGPTTEETAQAEAALKLIASSSLGENFKERMRGLISGTKSARPKDKLHALAKQGVIREEFIGTWKRLRDSYAHADLSDPKGLAKRHRSCQIVRTLLHELVFGVIGYEGEYTDYSVIGWRKAAREHALQSTL